MEPPEQESLPEEVEFKLLRSRWLRSALGYQQDVLRAVAGAQARLTSRETLER